MWKPPRWRELVCGTSVVKYTSEPPRVACAYLVGFRPSRLRKFLCAYFKHRVSCSFLFSCRIRSRLLPKPPDSELLNSPDTSSSTMECSFGITGTYQSFSFKVRKFAFPMVSIATDFPMSNKLSTSSFRNLPFLSSPRMFLYFRFHATPSPRPVFSALPAYPPSPPPPPPPPPLGAR